MKYLLVSLILAGLVAAPALAENPNPYTKPNNSWITISGTVEKVHANAFILDYGDGIITVEMDDGDRDAEAYNLLAGDEVTVFGKIDDDFFETTTIEASSVYVKKLGTSFFASAVDEEDFVLDFSYSIVPPTTVVSGMVTDVKDDEFVIDTGLRMLTVEVDEMPYDPLDDEGYQKVRTGDRVMVTGEMDRDLFEGRELVARSVITLNTPYRPGDSE